MHKVMMMLFTVLGAACSGSDDSPNTEHCAPNEFLGCSGAQTALRCNAEGTEAVTEACGATCDEAAGRCNTCEPSSTRCTADGSLETCSADGASFTTEACAAGCATQGAGARCKHIVPVWIPDACDAASPVAERTLAGTFDTGDATACDRVVSQRDAYGATIGPDICVVTARALAVEQVDQLLVTGPRALALVGDDVKIRGTLDISARYARSGPGGGFVANGQFDTFYGGGGAGFKQPGAAGGGNEFGANARLGGGLRNPLSEGGFSGGTRASDDTGPIMSIDDADAGGGGGGALIVACRGSVSVTGRILANGGFGGVGNNGNGGGGGGSGGHLVLQGARVAVSGQVTVDGGRGGPACGGFGNCRPSGEGGTGVQPPTPAPSHQSESTGGGGGSVGVVQVYTPVGIAPVLAPQTFAYEPNRTVTAR